MSGRNEAYIPGIEPALEANLTNAHNHARNSFNTLPADFITRMQGLIRRPTAQAMDDYAAGGYGLLDVIESQLPEDASLLDIIDASIGANGAQAKIVDMIKIKVQGKKSPTDVSNALTAKFAEASVFAFAVKHYDEIDTDTKGYLRECGYAADRLIRKASPAVAWQAAKAGIFTSSMRNAIHLLEWADHSSEGSSPAEIEQIAAENDALFDETRALLRYGIKSAIAPAVDEHDVKEWLFIPQDEFLGDNSATERMGIRPGNKTNSGIKYTMQGCVATVTGAPINFITSKPRPRGVDSEDGGVYTSGYALQELLGTEVDPSTSTFSVQLTKDGDLKTLRGLNLKEMFSHLGADEAYERLRSEILTIHFDLVTPASIQKIIEQELVTPPASGDTADQSPRLGKIRQLILARLRVIRILGDDIVDEFEQEEQHHKDIVVHGVINHLRDLPANYRASQEARDRCFKDIGIILPEFGQTYVKKHDRGTVEEINPLGHRTVSKHLGKVAAGRARRSGRTTPPGTRPTITKRK